MGIPLEDFRGAVRQSAVPIWTHLTVKEDSRKSEINQLGNNLWMRVLSYHNILKLEVSVGYSLRVQVVEPFNDSLHYDSCLNFYAIFRANEVKEVTTVNEFLNYEQVLRIFKDI